MKRTEQILELKSIMTKIFKKLPEVSMLYLSWHNNKSANLKTGQFILSGVRDKEKTKKRSRVS